jgi:hypothetical protein
MEIPRPAGLTHSQSAFPSSAGSRAMFAAMRRASSVVSTIACSASTSVAGCTLRRLPADPQPISQVKSSLVRGRGILIEPRDAQFPRPERVGILRAVSAAARARGDVMPLARSLVRIGASSAARTSARSDWALEPGLLLVRDPRTTSGFAPDACR